MAVIKIKLGDKPNFKKAKTVRIPIKISTIMVSLGILLWQYRHRPPKEINENTGTKSLFLSCVLQEKQTDRPFQNGKPVLYLFAITITKLPKAAPTKNIIIPKIYCMFFT